MVVIWINFQNIFIFMKWCLCVCVGVCVHVCLYAQLKNVFFKFQMCDGLFKYCNSYNYSQFSKVKVITKNKSQASVTII